MQRVVLSARELAIGYRLSGSETKVVHSGLNFELYSGELTSLLGANGAGKSTLIRSIARFINPLSGEIELMGRVVDSYSRAALARLISVVLTDRIFDTNLSVRDVISLGRYPYTGFFGRLCAKDHQIVEHSASLTGVEGMLARDIASLSDGERQKVFIAKSLAQQTPLIILDEPTAFLDVKSRIEIMELLHNLAREEQKSILISTHDMDVALKLSDSIWTLRPGEGIASGQTEDMLFAGSMSSLFDSADIDYDIQRATFVMGQKSGDKVVSVKGDDRFSRWIVSALEREGYSIAPCYEPLEVEVISKEEYVIKRDGIAKVATSVKELIGILNN